MREALLSEGGISCKVVTNTDVKSAEAIVKNYVDGRIPQNQKKEQILKALQFNPYMDEIYEIIWKDYGDKNNDLVSMSRYFGCSLEATIKKLANEYGTAVYEEFCGEYEKSYDKAQAAIRYEIGIKKAIEILENYCEEHNINETIIDVLPKCKKIIKETEQNLCTVHGKRYDSRELANCVKK